MKAIILYAAKYGTGCAGPFWPVYVSKGATEAKLPVFVRADLVEAQDVAHALSLAKPAPDGIVLNTIPATIPAQ